jgi:hypothetical protein
LLLDRSWIADAGIMIHDFEHSLRGRDGTSKSIDQKMKEKANITALTGWDGMVQADCPSNA